MLTVLQYEYPDGVLPSLKPRNTTRQFPGGWDWIQDARSTRDESFFEVTGNVGDVYILHPFMLHSASNNLLRTIRIITNPPVALKRPFNYCREDGKYSLVEQKTLRELGRPEGLPGWSITSSRERIIPDRIKVEFFCGTLS